jgi:hypothetical protein
MPKVVIYSLREAIQIEHFGHESSLINTYLKPKATERC